MNLERRIPMAKPQPEYKVRLVITNLREMRKISRKLRKERGVKTISTEEFFKYWKPGVKAVPCGGFKGLVEYVITKF